MITEAASYLMLNESSINVEPKSKKKQELIIHIPELMHPPIIPPFSFFLSDQSKSTKPRPLRTTPARLTYRLGPEFANDWETKAVGRMLDVRVNLDALAVAG